MPNPSENPLPIGHELTEGQLHHAVKVYGTQTCHDTNRSRALLDGLGIEYNFYNTDMDAAMARTADALRPNGGQKIPVIDLGEGNVLVEPSDDELTRALRAGGRLGDPAAF
jgi:glutaredoxin